MSAQQVSYAQLNLKSILQNRTQLEDYIKQEMIQSNIPGISLAVFTANEIIFFGNYGIADPSGRDLTSKTPFVIGSLSKYFTAFAVAELISRGKISPDVPISQYLRWFNPINAFDTSPITIRHLLTHTSGISGKDGIDFRDIDEHISFNDLLKTYASLRLDRPVGSSFEYSNVNYNLLGGIVQTVSGHSYGEYIQQNIFKRFGMNGSYTSLSKALSSGMARGHRLWFHKPIESPFYPSVEAFLPSMTLMSSAEDLSKFMIVTLTNRLSSGEPLLSADVWKSFFTPSATAILDGYRGQYDNGFLRAEIDGKPVMYLKGAYTGYRTYIIFKPQERIGLVILMNMNTMVSDQGLSSIAPAIMRFLSKDQLIPSPPNRTYLILISLFTVGFVFQFIRIFRVLINWKKRMGNPTSKKVNIRMTVRRIIVPLLFDGIILFGLIFMIPQMLGIYLSTLMLIQPDLTVFLYIFCTMIGLFTLVRTYWGIKTYLEDA